MTLTVSAVQSVISQLHPFPPYAMLTGGEPLMVKDIADIADIISSQETSLSICTNGAALSEHSNWISDTVDELFVSLWGAHANTHNRLRGKACFADIREGLAAIGKQKRRPKIIARFTVVPENLGDLSALVKTCRKLRIDGVSLQPGGISTKGFGKIPCRPAWHLSGLKPDMIAKSINDFEAEAVSANLMPVGQTDFTLRYIMFAIGAGESIHVPCNAPHRSLVIEPDLKASPCYFLPAVGDLNITNIADIVTGEALAKVQQDVSASIEKICETCVCPRMYPA